jgi:hypothetical protein
MIGDYLKGNYYRLFKKLEEKLNGFTQAESGILFWPEKRLRIIKDRHVIA